MCPQACSAGGTASRCHCGGGLLVFCSTCAAIWYRGAPVLVTSLSSAFRSGTHSMPAGAAAAAAPAAAPQLLLGCCCCSCRSISMSSNKLGAPLPALLPPTSAAAVAVSPLVHVPAPSPAGLGASPAAASEAAPAAACLPGTAAAPAGAGSGGDAACCGPSWLLIWRYSKG